MTPGKKGQVSGAPAASLIIVISAFILLYILFLPSEDRTELLEGSDGSGGTIAKGAEVSGSVLLLEQPGTLTHLKDTEFEHSIPSFNLFTEKEDVVLKSADSVFIDSKQNAKTLPVFVKGNVENAKLSFNVEQHEGRLMVKLNQEEIFKGEVKNIIEPLSLSLKEENVIEFSVEKAPGWQFWKKNFYDVRNVKVTATVERLENREALNTFFMTKEEADPENIEEAYIIYLADCSVKNAGKLGILLNGNLLSAKVPDCGSLEKTFIDPSDFVSGKNELLFRIEEGKYLIDQIFIKTQLRKPISQVYFFDMNRTQFKKVENDTINASISLRFIDDKEKHTGVIDINAHKIFFNTIQSNFSKGIDQFVVEGSNSVRIEPETTLSITELKVELDCKKKADCS